MNISAQWTPDSYYILPFILIAKVEDEHDQPAGSIVQVGWLGLAITAHFDPPQN